MARKKIIMNEKRIIRIAIASSGNTIKSAAEKAGIKGISLSNQLGNLESTMTLTSVYSLLDAIGFEIVVRKKGERESTQEYVLSEIDPEKELDQKSEEKKATRHRIAEDGLLDNIQKAEPRKPIQTLPIKKMK
jgi:hypothetical protein